MATLPQNGRANPLHLRRGVKQTRTHVRITGAQHRVLRRVRGVVSDRRVSIRPAPDTMALVTGFLQVVQGVAVHASLTQAAASAQALGDPRSKGHIMADTFVEIMADTFVERVTGQATADGVPLEVQLIMTDRTLLAGDVTPAQIPGFGPVPAAFVRDLLADRAGDSGDVGNEAVEDRDVEDRDRNGVGGKGDGRGELTSAELAQVWLRRLFASPNDGTLVAMDSRRRRFDGLLRQFLVTRDQICRTPWGDAPIRHIDHIAAVADGGRTSAANGQGICARCNYTKELVGWRTEVVVDPGRHRVRTTTPTGHTYESTAPPLLGLHVAQDMDARHRRRPAARERPGADTTRSPTGAR